MVTAVEHIGWQELNGLVKLQAILERGRISAANQLRGIGQEHGRVRQVQARVTETLEGLERLTEAAMHEEAQGHPAWPWLMTIRGIGPQTACLLLAYLLPPIGGKGPSSWYKAAGLYAITAGDGESRLPRYQHLNGERATWHPRLRRNLYVVSECLIRAGGFYYAIYSEVKAALQIKHPDWKGRCHAVARWKMVKLFLAHLWEVWARAEGISVREPYPVEILGHQKIAVPWEGG